MADRIARIQASVVDGRARTPRYISRQLSAIHDAIVGSVDVVHHAIVGDTGVAPADAWLEITAALNAVRADFASIDVAGFLDREYSIANGKDNALRRSAYGCAVIVPCRHTYFYSVVQPLSAAIAAGNCVVLEIPQTPSELAHLLRTVLDGCLDRDTFAIVDRLPSDLSFFSHSVVVLDGAGVLSLSSVPGPAVLVQSSASVSIAVVDRSSDLSHAASSIIHSRSHFAGTSPYAPSLVLVNEFAVDEFCQAAVRCLTADLQATESSASRSRRAGDETTKRLVQEAIQKNDASLLVDTALGSIVLLRNRKSSLLPNHVSSACMIVVAIRSLDDAIDLANSRDRPLLAAYHFAIPKAAKYLGQFIDAGVSFTGHIPVEVLIGPAAPTRFPLSIGSRIPSQAVTFPKPEYLHPPQANQSLVDLLESASPSHIECMKAALRKPLPRSEEPGGRSMGFFEQGLATSAALVTASSAVLLGIAVFRFFQR